MVCSEKRSYGMFFNDVLKFDPILDAQHFKPNILPLLEFLRVFLSTVLKEKAVSFEDWKLVPCIPPRSNYPPSIPAVWRAAVYAVGLSKIIGNGCFIILSFVILD